MNSHADVRCHFTKAAEGIVYLNPEQELPSFDDVRAVIIEMLDIKNINEAFERVVKGDVKYRFVIDMKTLKA